MKPSERDPLLYLEDIKLSMERIQEYLTELNFTNFQKDYKTIDAVIRNFEIIGEASKKLPDAVKIKNSHIPWEEMYRLRNRVSHSYFGIDYEIIWSIITDQLPQNYLDILQVISEQN